MSTISPVPPQNPASPTSPDRPVPSRRARPRARSLTALAASAALGASVLAGGGTAHAEEAGSVQRYVALGDSFTAGPLIPPAAQGAHPVCLQSENNYPRLVAQALDVGEFVDASCSGAVTRDMTESQHPGLLWPVGPQFDALTEDTDLVTVGIGGNDFGFTEILTNCARLSVRNPLGNPCQREYGDEFAERLEDVRGDIAGVYAGIAERSPQASIVTVGYLQILPERTGCWPMAPIARGDVPYLDGVQTSLNALIAEESAAVGATFVDVLERGHDVCADSGVRWVEGLAPSNPAAPVHPNANGMAATADRVLASMGLEGAPMP